MHKKLPKIGLLLIAIINCPYVLFLISGLEPDPVASEKVAENTVYVIISTVILSLMCVAGLFVRGKCTDIYRKCSRIFAGLRVIAGEFGIFWLTTYQIFREKGNEWQINLVSDADKYVLVLRAGIILFLFALPLMGHIAALMCFEYGLEKDKRVAINSLKITLICLSIITSAGIAAVVFAGFNLI